MTVTALLDWKLQCSACGSVADPAGLPTVCPRCGQPWLVRYPARRPTLADRDKVDAAIDASRAAGWGLTPEQQGRFAAKFGGGSVPQYSAAGPNQSSSAAAPASAAPRATPAPQDLAQLLGTRELRVRVVNPKEIGQQERGALGGATPVPGWKL